MTATHVDHEFDTEDRFEKLDASGAIEAVTRGEIDIQIATAHKYPRSIARFRADALAMATLDEETAESCFYSLPRGGKPIEGPSARLAEICASAWGNLRAASRVVSIDDKFVTVQSVCHDLQRNVAISTEVKRRITGSNGRRFNDDLVTVTANAASSIALRNAVFKVIPMAYVRQVYAEARRVAIGDATTLEARRAKAFDHFRKMGVLDERILAVIGKAAIDDVGLDELATLKGLATAIKEGDTTVDEAFPAIAKDLPTEENGQRRMKLGGRGRPAEAPASQPPAATDTAAPAVAAPEPETGAAPPPAQESPASAPAQPEAAPAPPADGGMSELEKLAVQLSEKDSITAARALERIGAYAREVRGKPAAELNESELADVHIRIKTGSIDKRPKK